MAKAKKQDELEQQIGELTQDLQRTRADFENYRKRVESEKTASYQHGRAAAISKLLSIVDDIERAVTHLPKELADNTWAKGVAGLTKKLENSLDKLGVKRITSKPGTTFDPSLHDAIQMDEDAEGETEVIAEELQAGYTLEGESLRPAMVKVTRK